jgi:hypothetical protein
MYLLFLIVLNSSGSSVSTNASKFNSESNCLQAISKILEMESRNGVRIQARCVKE